MKEIKTVPLPIMPIKFLGNAFLPRPLIKKPINGSSGISIIKFFMLFSSLANVVCKQLLMFQSVQKVDVSGMRIAVQHYNYC